MDPAMGFQPRRRRSMMSMRELASGQGWGMASPDPAMYGGGPQGNVSWPTQAMPTRGPGRQGWMGNEGPTGQAFAAPGGGPLMAYERQAQASSAPPGMVRNPNRGGWIAGGDNVDNREFIPEYEARAGGRNAQGSLINPGGDGKLDRGQGQGVGSAQSAPATAAGFFRGRDPNSRLTGAQAWGELNAMAGGGLTDAHRAQAMQFLNYTDPTGATEIQGSDWNRLAQQAAQLFGGQFTPWEAPSGGSPPPGGGNEESPGFPVDPEDDVVLLPYPGPYKPPSPALPWHPPERVLPPETPPGVGPPSGPTEYPAYGTRPMNLPTSLGAPTGGPLPTFQAPTYTAPGAFQAPTYTAPGAFQAPTYTGPEAFQAPSYAAPGAFGYQSFAAPGEEGMQEDPGYKVRLKQGLDAIQARNAAGGNLLTGGSMKGLIDYAGDAASEEYQNVYNRRWNEHAGGYAQAADTYGINRQTGLDAYDRQYQGTRDAYQLNRQAGLDAYDRNYQGSRDAYQLNRQAGLDAFDRNYAGSRDAYQLNRQAGLDAFDRNYGGARDAFDRNYAGAVDTRNFDWQSQLQRYDREVDAEVLRDRAFRGDRDFQFGRDVWDDERRFRREQWQDDRSFRDRSYESGERRWRQEFDQRAREFMSNDQFRRFVYGTDDEYRRYRDSVSDAWKREVMDEERRRFLAELGTR